MATFKNISALGALEVPMLRRVIAEGETFEVNDEHAIYIAGQRGNFEPVDEAAVAARDEYEAELLDDDTTESDADSAQPDQGEPEPKEEDEA